MEKFSKYVESIILTIPTSDSVGPVAKSEPNSNVEEIAKDGFSQTADDILNGTSDSSDDAIQPDDNVGEFGEIDGKDEDCDCTIEATDEGLSIDFNGIKVVLPDSVREKLKSFLSEDGVESSDSDTEESTDSDSDVESSEDSEEDKPEESGDDDVFEPSEKESEDKKPDDK